MDEQELIKLRDMIAAAVWRPTKYVHPHEYVLRKNEPFLCEAIQAAVLKFGFYGSFQGTRYRYWEFEGYRYWHFIEVFNRERLTEGSAWR